MMKRETKLVIGIVLAVLIILASTIAYADNEVVGTNITIIGGNTTTVQNTTTQNTTTTNTTTNSTSTIIVGGNTTGVQNTAVINTTTSYNTQNTTTTLPQTGENDVYVVTALVAVCAISAIFAYRKIRDYNIK